MDLLSILRTKIASLESGEHTPGLAAVLLHMETAISHLGRGKDLRDETAFTDAIYRTNQAFEGSIKEAYRVIAGKDPERTRPFDIEEYLQANGVLRQRVLAQFSNYRREWRNPSSHDYKLDFDESEAFLAIVSVAGFACVLLDQIGERLSFLASKAAADARGDQLRARLAKTTGQNLAVRLVEILREFSHVLSLGSEGTPLPITEANLIGAITGFIASSAPALETDVEKQMGPTARPDIVVSDGNERVIIEVKRLGPVSGRALQVGLTQLDQYLRLSGAAEGILFLVGQGDVQVEEHLLGRRGRILVIRPEGS